MKDTGARSTLTWSASPLTAPLPTTSPLDAGATLRVVGANGEEATFRLPASGWTSGGGGTRYRYENSLAPAGPSGVRRVSLRRHRSLKLTARAAGLTLDEPTQEGVRIELLIGDDVYCSSCDVPIRDEPGRFVARRCAAPSACLPPTTTTVTSTSSTTTTTAAPFCGNDVRDQSNEQCDGADPGSCPTEPVEGLEGFTFACNGPTSATPCQCCVDSMCVVESGFPPPPGVLGRCCDDAVCQATTGGGTHPSGVCIPPSCTSDDDCNGYACAAGTCCGRAGHGCDVIGCCVGDGVTCTDGWLPVSMCCRATGGGCTDSAECCSGLCDAGACS